MTDNEIVNAIERNDYDFLNQLDVNRLKEFIDAEHYFNSISRDAFPYSYVFYTSNTKLFNIFNKQLATINYYPLAEPTYKGEKDTFFINASFSYMVDNAAIEDEEFKNIKLFVYLLAEKRPLVIANDELGKSLTNTVPSQFKEMLKIVAVQPDITLDGIQLWASINLPAIKVMNYFIFLITKTLGNKREYNGIGLIRMLKLYINFVEYAQHDLLERKVCKFYLEMVNFLPIKLSDFNYNTILDVIGFQVYNIIDVAEALNYTLYNNVPLWIIIIMTRRIDLLNEIFNVVQPKDYETMYNMIMNLKYLKRGVSLWFYQFLFNSPFSEHAFLCAEFSYCLYKFMNFSPETFSVYADETNIEPDNLIKSYIERMNAYASVNNTIMVECILTVIENPLRIIYKVYEKAKNVNMPNYGDIVSDKVALKSFVDYCTYLKNEALIAINDSKLRTVINDMDIGDAADYIEGVLDNESDNENIGDIKTKKKKKKKKKKGGKTDDNKIVIDNQLMQVIPIEPIEASFEEKEETLANNSLEMLADLSLKENPTSITAFIPKTTEDNKFFETGTEDVEPLPSFVDVDDRLVKINEIIDIIKARLFLTTDNTDERADVIYLPNELIWIIYAGTEAILQQYSNISADTLEFVGDRVLKIIHGTDSLNILLERNKYDDKKVLTPSELTKIVTELERNETLMCYFDSDHLNICDSIYFLSTIGALTLPLGGSTTFKTTWCADFFEATVGGIYYYYNSQFGEAAGIQKARDWLDLIGVYNDHKRHIVREEVYCASFIKVI